MAVSRPRALAAPPARVAEAVAHGNAERLWRPGRIRAPPRGRALPTSRSPAAATARGGLAPRLKRYHIFELKDEIPPEVREREMAIKALQAGDARIESLVGIMKTVRGEG